MARILCTQKLWRALGHFGQPPRDVAAPLIYGVALGSWAAKVFRIEGRDLVMALDERTYLTLVFPLAPSAQFRTNFANALSMALTDLGVPESDVHTEVAALAFEPLARLTDKRMTATLRDLEFYCGLELLYHDDLRTVQRNLNDVPHGHRDPCVPLEAVARVFTRPRPEPAPQTH